MAGLAISMPITGVDDIMLCVHALQAPAWGHLMNSFEPSHIMVHYMPMLILVQIDTRKQAYVDKHGQCASGSALAYKSWQCAMTRASFQCRTDWCFTCMCVAMASHVLTDSHL